jgi:hypothetical protein
MPDRFAIGRYLIFYHSFRIDDGRYALSLKPPAHVRLLWVKLRQIEVGLRWFGSPPKADLPTISACRNPP